MDIDEDLKLAAKNWSRVINAASKTGYKEGIDDGSESVFQKGFDKGFIEGMRISFILGQYKGMMTYLSDDIKYPEEITNILSTTRHGSCYICKYNVNKTQNELEHQVEDTIKCQKNHSQQLIKILQDFFTPIMKQRGISIEHLKL